MRHAKSSWDNPNWTDFERPLNERGKRDLLFMSSKFSKSDNRIERVISSNAARAFVTAKSFCAALSLSDSQFILEPEIYEASLPMLLSVIHDIPEPVVTVMMFGHNPGFSQLAFYLTGQYFEMSTCSIVHIEFAEKQWKLINANSGFLVDFDFPKKHLCQ